MGHRVRVLTQSSSSDPADDHGFEVLRRPAAGELRRAILWADVFSQNNISLRTVWPLIFTHRSWWVTTQTWLGRSERSPGLHGKLKRFVLGFARNLYISQAIASHVGHPGVIVGNPYDAETFRLIGEIPRDRDIVFLGRLVSDKGCDTLIEALALLQQEGQVFRTTIIGDGPEKSKLEAQARRLGLEQQVQFAGKLSGQELATELNRHRIMAIPSRWNEPFGIVALEGMACGCIPVVSAGGGLQEATGGCGISFPNGDAVGLSRALLEAHTLPPEHRETMVAHTKKFHPTTIAQRYLEEFEKGLHEEAIRRIS